MRVEIEYFRHDSGKFYTNESYDTNETTLHGIWDELRERMRAGSWPGLIAGQHDFITRVNVPGHLHEHPRLIMPWQINRVVTKPPAYLGGMEEE